MIILHEIRLSKRGIMQYMCGIVGFVDKLKEKDTVIKAMADTIIHRGPDSEGLYTDEDVALGFRRLSIIDVECGTQPIFNEDGSLLILFNGEIYNYQGIRETLIERGHVFKTHADTEVILHGFEEYGEDIVKQLRGMFSFVIWNTKTHTMFGARDHFGIKPLYYAQMNGTFMFGSEIKSFLKHPNFVKEVNKEALKPYLTFQYSAIDETFFKGVFRVPEGHSFTYENGELIFKEYWDHTFNPVDMTLENAVDKIEDVMIDSVKHHQIADVTVGSFLSSGIDSSFVTSLLKPEHSFSVGFENKNFDETVYARELSEMIEVENHSKIVTPEEAFDKFGKVLYHLDEPDSNPSCVPLYFLSELARKHVTVVLSGEGADELFAGYTDYGFNSKSPTVRKVAETMKGLPVGVRHGIAKTLSKMPNFKGKRQLYRSLAPAEDHFIGQAFIFTEKESDDILQTEYQSAPSVKSIVGKTYAKVSDAPELTKMQYLDLHQWMTKDILLKADKLSMAHSIELRVPFLDKEVMTVAGSIPSKYLLNDIDTKYALRVAAGRHLPEEWAKREKLGFPVPVRAWLKEAPYYNKVRTLFQSDAASEFFNTDKITALLDNHYNGVEDNGRKVWTIFTFLTWYDTYFTNIHQYQ